VCAAVVLASALAAGQGCYRRVIDDDGFGPGGNLQTGRDVRGDQGDDDKQQYRSALEKYKSRYKP